jgi:tRNA threonylcarbamoyladenosine biosynthesis protein TsaB
VSKISDNPEPLILVIETATRAGSVVLARGREILWSASGDASASHSTDLIETIEKGLKSTGTKLSEVDLFAAARGPGSFTGLRIGLATIKAFAVCTRKRCAGVSTLAAIAHAAGASEHTVSLLPAGRGELFAQLFSVREGTVRELDTAAHLAPRAVLERYGAEPELVWAGDGAHLHAAALRDWSKARNLSFNEQRSDSASQTQTGWSLGPAVDQLAISIAALALEVHCSGNTVTPDDLQAVYVRASDAEINEQWLQEK